MGVMYCPRPRPGGSGRLAGPDPWEDRRVSEELRLEKDGPVATLTLNRPERMNAITGQSA